jgi:ABC-type multidrug transport system ATPase subunit
VKVRNIEGALTFRELSEGEQQLLTVLGLLRFTKEQESLFLLDEPDTHLNPTWSQQYLNLLRQVLGENASSHVLIASHDPLVVAGLERSQVQIMQRDSGSGRVTARIPDEDPKGMGIGGILTSDLFGLRSTLDPETLGKLDRKRELATKEELTNEERTELEQLNKSLGNVDFTHSVRDPLYKQFVEAMVALDEYRQLRKPTLSQQERERQKQMAEQVLQGIKDGQSK